MLFLSVCFPSPTNLTLGVWALRQAHAIQRGGAEIKVVRFTPWFPTVIRNHRRIRRVADAPATHKWGDLEAKYFRWPLYQAGWPRRQAYQNPWLQAKLSFAFVRSALLREIEESHPEVIYAHHTEVSGYVAYRLHQLTGIPYVITDHSLPEIEDCDRLPNRRGFFGEVQANASCMVDISKRMQGIRHSIFPDVNSVLVHNGADPIPENMLHVPRPPEISGKLVVCCVAGWFACKGMPKLVEAFNAVAGEFPKAVLRLVGDGPDRPAVMTAVAASAAKDRIHILGSQPHERALQEMCWADQFAMIGREEAYGVVFTEAMMAGLPLIWPNDCGHSDVLADGVNGFDVPPWDVSATAAAMRKLLSDAELRHNLGRFNREFAEEKLTWDANATKMLGIFRDAATRSKVALAREKAQ